MISKERKILRETLRSKCDTNLVDSGQAYGYGYEYYQQHYNDNIPYILDEENTYEYKKGDEYIYIYQNLPYFIMAYGIRVPETLFLRNLGVNSYNIDEYWNDINKEFESDFNGDEEPQGYTYNYDARWSEDFQFYYDSINDMTIIFVHTGCDARWGFSEPIVVEGDGLLTSGIDGDIALDIFKNAIWDNIHNYSDYTVAKQKLYELECLTYLDDVTSILTPKEINNGIKQAIDNKILMYKW